MYHNKDAWLVRKGHKVYKLVGKEKELKWFVNPTLPSAGPGICMPNADSNDTLQVYWE